MVEWAQSLTGFKFATSAYFSFLFLTISLLLFLSSSLILKIFFRPRRSKSSRYRLFGRDVIWLFCFTLAGLIVVALAGPEKSSGLVVSSGGNVDIIFAIDNSFSTSADDLKPTRLELAKKEIFKFLSSGVLQKGDRFTLFTFAKNSNWRMPFSEDIDELGGKIAEIGHPELYIDESQLTTDLSAILEHIPKAMDKADNFYKSNRNLGISNFSNDRMVFLFTDGDDQAKGSLDKGLGELKKRKIKVYPVGVGTKTGRSVRIKVFKPSQIFYDPESGQQLNSTPSLEEEVVVRSVLQTQNLSKVAGFTGGQLFVLDSEQNYLKNFMENAINSNRTASLRLSTSSGSKNMWWEVLAIPAVIVLFFVILLI